MNADHYMRAPTLKELGDISDATLMKKLARLWPKPVYAPVKVLHPVLPIPQQPVVDTYHSGGQRMRLFNRPNHAHRIRLPVEKLLHACDNCSRGGTVTTASVRRDN